MAHNISLNPTQPKQNEHNISKLYFGLALTNQQQNLLSIKLIKKLTTNKNKVTL